MESALYTGKVFHQRFVPKRHGFSYNIFLLWLKLDEVEQLNQNLLGFSSKGFAPLQFKRSDYLGDAQEPLQQSVLTKMSKLAGQALHGDVFFLGQVRNFAMYFSPVNFYFLRNNLGQYSHMLAEVSNTPWNQRHCYLVDLAVQADCAKTFHVSPFNPMDMLYRWRIAPPASRLELELSCYKNQRHFSAGLKMQRQPLNSKTLRNVIIRMPSMMIKTVAGIYWQALKLAIKRLPIYSHPDKQKG